MQCRGSGSGSRDLAFNLNNTDPDPLSQANAYPCGSGSGSKVSRHNTLNFLYEKYNWCWYVLVRSHKTYLRRYKRLLKAGIKVSLVNCGQFPCSWIRIRIRISSSDPDPQHWINATGRKCMVLPCFFRSCLFSNVCQFSCVPGMYVLD